MLESGVGTLVSQKVPTIRNRIVGAGVANPRDLAPNPKNWRTHPVPQLTVEGGHSTQKPVECMERPIRNHDAPEVYDPFLGSGATLIACERLERRCYAMEIEPRYVDVAVRRWELYTGQKAVPA